MKKKTKEEIIEDSAIIFQIMADPKKYNVLSELRNGLISKDKLPKLVLKKFIRRQILIYKETNLDK